MEMDSSQPDTGMLMEGFKTPFSYITKPVKMVESLENICYEVHVEGYAVLLIKFHAPQCTSIHR